MAISQNDPDNWPNNVYAYDPEPRGKTLTRTTFNWLTATVDRVWAEGQSFGIKFVEDPGGDIWNISGAWDDATNRFLPYEGYQYKSGEKVDVQLSMRTYNKNDGSPGVGRAITKIRMNDEYSRVSQPAAEAPVEAPAETPAAQQPAQQPVQQEAPVQEPILTTDQRIAKAQALNIIKDLLVAGLSTEIGLTEEAGWVIIRDETMRLAQGKAVDLSYLSPLVAAAIENGGTVTEVKDSNNPDEEVEELKW
tara:strand:+ start:214 stop:960 length:747 start_codon:yes stop_codon:yes gene_type:complete